MVNLPSATHLKACVLLLALTGSLSVTGCAEDKKKDDKSDKKTPSTKTVAYKAYGQLVFAVKGGPDPIPTADHAYGSQIFEQLQEASDTALATALKNSLDKGFSPMVFTITVGMTDHVSQPDPAPTLSASHTPTPTAAGAKYTVSECKSYEPGSSCHVGASAILRPVALECRLGGNARHYYKDTIDQTGCYSSTPSPTTASQTPAPTQSPAPTVATTPIPTGSAAPTHVPTPHPTTPFPTPSICGIVGQHGDDAGSPVPAPFPSSQFKELKFYYEVSGGNVYPTVTKYKRTDLPTGVEYDLEYDTDLVPAGETYSCSGTTAADCDDTGDDPGSTDYPYVDVTSWSATQFDAFMRSTVYTQQKNMWDKIFLTDQSQEEHQSMGTTLFLDVLYDLTNQSNSSTDDYICGPTLQVYDSPASAIDLASFKTAIGATPSGPKDIYFLANAVAVNHKAAPTMCIALAAKIKGCVLDMNQLTAR